MKMSIDTSVKRTYLRSSIRTLANALGFVVLSDTASVSSAAAAESRVDVRFGVRSERFSGVVMDESFSDLQLVAVSHLQGEEGDNKTSTVIVDGHKSRIELIKGNSIFKINNIVGLNPGEN